MAFCTFYTPAKETLRLKGSGSFHHLSGAGGRPTVKAERCRTMRVEALGDADLSMVLAAMVEDLIGVSLQRTSILKSFRAMPIVGWSR